MTPQNPQRPLALRPREAAAALSISERTLWSLTAPRGPIPAARAGRSVLYRVADLDAWLQSAATPAAADDVRTNERGPAQ